MVGELNEWFHLTKWFLDLLELISMKTSKEEWKCGFDPFLEKKTLFRVLLLIVYRSWFRKLGETFGTSSFHLPNFERILGS